MLISGHVIGACLAPIKFTKQYLGHTYEAGFMHRDHPDLGQQGCIGQACISWKMSYEFSIASRLELHAGKPAFYRLASSAPAQIGTTWCTTVCTHIPHAPRELLRMILQVSVCRYSTQCLFQKTRLYSVLCYLCRSFFCIHVVHVQCTMLTESLGSYCTSPPSPL